MKKVLIATVGLALVAGTAFGTVVGSKHDLSSATGPNATYQGANDGGEVCVYCHTPHGASAAGIAPLWNRGTVLATNAYANSSLNHTVNLGDGTQPSNAVNSSDAPLCLSCHAGTALTTALNNAPNYAGFTNVANDLSGATTDLGADLSNDHPVGFVFNATLDGELQAPTTAPVNFGAGGNEMWCSSCHDVHGGAAGTPFLVMSNSGSALCVDCHVK